MNFCTIVAKSRALPAAYHRLFKFLAPGAREGIMALNLWWIFGWQGLKFDNTIDTVRK
jgi:hypothetical protein